MLKYYSGSKFVENPITNKVCGEIVYQSESNFVIVCVFCKIKLFEIKEFNEHFHNAHIGELRGENNDLNIYHNSVDISHGNNEYNTNILYTECADNKIVLSNNPSIENAKHSKQIIDCQKELKFECDICLKAYKSKTRLIYHIKIKHSSDQNIKCTLCEDLFVEQKSFDTHMKKKHNILLCNICNKDFKTPTGLREHMYNHNGTKDILCDYPNCGKAFVSMKRMKNHKLIHINEKNLICETCGYRSRCKLRLDIHKRSHTGERPFPCPDCGKRFISKSSLVEHKPIHSTERPHQCEICGASFSRPKALYHHKHLHLDIKKFICILCGHAYAQAAGLANHMRQHRKNNNILNEVEY